MATAILTLLMLFYLADRSWSSTSGLPPNGMEVWAFICMANLVFIMYASIYLIFARNVNIYLKQTILAFTVLFIAGIALGVMIGKGNILYSTYGGVLIAEILVFFVCVAMSYLISRGR